MIKRKNYNPQGWCYGLWTGFEPKLRLDSVPPPQVLKFNKYGVIMSISQNNNKNPENKNFIK